MYHKSKKLTKKANEIFGGIVKNAYISLSDISEIEERDILIFTVEKNCDTITDIESRCGRSEDSFEIEGDTIALQFFNDSFVEFQVSEWLTISSIEFKNKKNE